MFPGEPSYSIPWKMRQSSLSSLRTYDLYILENKIFSIISKTFKLLSALVITDQICAIRTLVANFLTKFLVGIMAPEIDPRFISY